MPKRIAIVGGGFLGAELARGLEAHAHVTLIEQNSHFVHAPAMLRALVTPELLERALIPYDRLLQRGQLVQARAQAVDGEGVTLNDGTRVEADYIVLATGSGNAMPFRPQSEGPDAIDQLRADNARVHQQLVAAQRIVIVGAGAVGTELAGEIAHHMPEKSVTLVSAHSKLFPSYAASLGRSLTRKLRTAGVEVILGARAEELADDRVPHAGKMTLTNGRVLEADLIFPTIGGAARSALVDSLPGIAMGQSNRVKTDPWLRPSRLTNIFAAGDLAECGDAMTVVATTRQLPWLIKTLRQVCAGKQVEDLRPYSPWGKPPILVPLGPKRGNSFLVAATVGDMATAQIKGRDLFLSKFNKAFGQPANRRR